MMVPIGNTLKNERPDIDCIVFCSEAGSDHIPIRPRGPEEFALEWPQRIAISLPRRRRFRHHNSGAADSDPGAGKLARSDGLHCYATLRCGDRRQSAWPRAKTRE